MNLFRNAPAFIIWALAILAILTPPEISAAGIASLVDAQQQMFDLLVEDPVQLADVAPTLPARA